MPLKALSELTPAYRSRIERGLSRGLSRSQARGHPTRSEQVIAQRFGKDFARALGPIPLKNPAGRAEVLRWFSHAQQTGKDLSNRADRNQIIGAFRRAQGAKFNTWDKSFIQLMQTIGYDQYQPEISGSVRDRRSEPDEEQDDFEEDEEAV